MTTLPPDDGRRRRRDDRGTRRRRARRRAGAVRQVRWGRLTRRHTMMRRQIFGTSGLVLLALLAAAGMVLSPQWMPQSAMLFILLLGVFMLRVTGMALLCATVLGALVVMTTTGLRTVPPGVFVVVTLGAVAGMVFVRSRSRLGLQGAASDLMLVDLRDRLVAHGRIPPLPQGWRVDSVVRSANAEAFSGDFVVAARSQHGQMLEIVLVDVSGKGQEAGVRSLLLSGAFGGLLGAMPREAFLPAANNYLLDQNWPEGFATAIHVAVRLDTGQFWVSTAGHPPAVQLHAGSGRIERLDTTGGPALGVVVAPLFSVHTGVLQHGDTVMLYTDGLIEAPGADVELGIDRLMGAAERFISTRSGGADAVLAGVRAGEGDDRGLILIHRD
ncbi:PP2C family protein-serine/threonine phosphatase [Actinotalea sp. Marseille-Q4924]|uniref:PP2C family protein-serine/threonine phosphatase n=1 Tax=Actinotalea sp. Marseille-Q4924 TaxID=2866571 RepID=UPI001CE48DC4|nr:PP2C family protein-serine/threonine phosphatase [Actinotalea sp. Marseille-Q4924]